MKRTVSFLTAAALILALLPMLCLTALAHSGVAEGDGIAWLVDDENALTVSGEGPMEDIAFGQWDSWIMRNITAATGWAVRAGDIRSILVTDGITYVGNAAFAKATGSRTATMEEGVEIIGSRAFLENQKMTEVHIPESVTEIGYMAFYHCGSLKDVYYAGSEAMWNAIVIEDENDDLLNANIHFGKTERLWGDADNSGEIDYMDAMMVLRHAVKLAILSEEAQAVCNVDGQGEIDYMDAMLILRHAVKLIDKFPAENG